MAIELFPVQSCSLAQVKRFVESDPFILSKWSMHLPCELDEDFLVKNLTETQRSALFWGRSPDAPLGLVIVDMPRWPPGFARVELLAEKSNEGEFSEFLDHLNHYLFHEMAFESGQISFLEVEKEKMRLLREKSWSLDAVLKEARLFKGEWVDEYWFGMVRDEFYKNENKSLMSLSSNVTPVPIK